MVDNFGMTGIAVVVFLILAAIYIFTRLLGKPTWSDEEEEEAEPEEEEKFPDIPAIRKEMSDEEFIDSYTGPIMDDALDKLESAVDSIKSGIDHYKGSVWEAAGEDFHSAVREIDNASSRFKEVVSMVEDQRSKPSRQANARIEEGRKLRVQAIHMEEACDARVEGKWLLDKDTEAAMPELERLATSFKK